MQLQRATNDIPTLSTFSFKWTVNKYLIEQQLNNLEQQINLLDKRITNLETMYNNNNSISYNNKYNSSNYQMM